MRNWNVLILALFLSQPLLATEGAKEKTEDHTACAEEASSVGSERDVASKDAVATEDAAYAEHLKVIDRMDRIR